MKPVVSGAPPLIYLALNKDIRKQVIKILGLQKAASVYTSSVAVTTAVGQNWFKF